MYFCYGIKNSTLEQFFNEGDNHHHQQPSADGGAQQQQPIELRIPGDRLRQSIKRREETAQKPQLSNGLTIDTTTVPQQPSQQPNYDPWAVDPWAVDPWKD